jgi:hypothetical protein
MVQSWTNSDGLYIKYGPDKATAKKAGEFVKTGDVREVFLTLTLSELTETETILDDTCFLPAGARIQEIETVTHTAAATGVAVDLGLIRMDRSTELDYDGLLAAIPTASMNAAGEKNIFSDNTTYDGALVGTTLAYNGYISASRTTSTAFTAGVIRVKIRYYMP